MPVPTVVTVLPRSEPVVEALPATADVPALWRAVARAVQRLAERHGLSPADVVVLLPFAQHLPLARTAWAEAQPASFLPRFETTETLARRLVPWPEAAPGAFGFDAVADRLQAAALLRRQLPDWPRRDARGFALAASRLADTAGALVHARLASQPWAARAAWLAEARARLAVVEGPGAQERALARLALEWSLTADSASTDALFAHRPGAWVALRGVTVDPLVESLLAAAEVPALRLQADVDAVAALATAPVLPAVASCRDFEDEAQRAAAAVLDHLTRGEVPVALIALDRVLVRRVRALLERAGPALADETGWKLSTTRAGARIVGLLRALQPRASTDDALGALKSLPLRSSHAAGLATLEADCRRHGLTVIAQVEGARLEGEAAELWRHWQHLGEPLRAPRRLPLADWLARLRDTLERAALWQSLEEDAAGAQVLDALRCRDPSPAVWPAAVLATQLDAAGLLDWVDQVLEQVAFRPPSAVEPQVVVTPLARAALRPFAAIVCPGADAAHLGAWPVPEALLGDALAVALGLTGARDKREAERSAFNQLLRAPRLTLLWRGQDGSEPLQASPLLRQWRLGADVQGRSLVSAPDPRSLLPVEPQPLERPAPTAPAALLLKRIDASSYEALRACPYRYFAQRLLALREAEELDDAVDKADYGQWLHAVLEAFHARRGAARDRVSDAALLDAVAAEQQAALGLDDASFLPYAAWFGRLAPRYLDWLATQEAAGASVRETELTLEAQPAELAGVGLRLQGRIDRIDHLARGDGLRILDYKTSGADTLRQRLRRPGEDTQLAFYAALLVAARGHPAGELQAAYLALDGKDGVRDLPQADVEASAARLVEGLADDFSRLHAGAAMPALGEGSACEHCSARGLCRRDHWSAAA